MSRNRAGLRLAGIDLEALGLLRAFVEPGRSRFARPTTPRPLSSRSDTNLRRFSSRAAASASSPASSTGAERAARRDRAGAEVHPAEAATILRHLSLSGPGRQFEGLDEDAREPRRSTRCGSRLTPFARELVSSLQFYQTQPESLGIGEIVITGGTSHLEGLADALHQMIGVAGPRRRSAAAASVRTRRRRPASSDDRLAGCPDRARDRRRRSAQRRPARRRVEEAGARTAEPRSRRPIPVAAAVPLAALGLLFSQAHGDVSASSSPSSMPCSAAINALPQPTKPADRRRSRTATRRRGRPQSRSVLGGRFAWENVFRDLSRALPANVWLTSTVSAAGAAPRPTRPRPPRTAARPAAAGWRRRA